MIPVALISSPGYMGWRNFFCRRRQVKPRRSTRGLEHAPPLKFKSSTGPIMPVGSRHSAQTFDSFPNGNKPYFAYAHYLSDPGRITFLTLDGAHFLLRTLRRLTGRNRFGSRLQLYQEPISKIVVGTVTGWITGWWCVWDHFLSTRV
jgi:hypothetical protein